MTLPCVADLTEPPVVGRYYRVPTVTGEWYGEVDDWPVMGPPHNDVAFFDFPNWHFHFDLRFLTGRQVSSCDGGKRPWREWYYGSPLQLDARGERFNPAAPPLPWPIGAVWLLCAIHVWARGLAS